MLTRCFVLQASPEFKGIKTVFGVLLVNLCRFKPALNSKGLRRAHAAQFLQTPPLQASPEFKGIKTD